MSQIDPRGQQFAAGLTSVTLGLVLATAPSPFASALLAVQTALFAWAVLRGVQSTPHAWLFRTLVRPRIKPPIHTEDSRPPRFAQGVGLAFAVVGLLGLLTGATTVGLVAVGFALAAALLNAVFGFCLGCELYLLGKRLTHSAGATANSATH